MPLLATKYFGTVTYESIDVLHFPDGLPAFDRENSFVLIDMPGRRPLVFLQSAAREDLCFIALPLLVLDPEYELSVSNEDLSSLKMEPDRQPRIGSEVLVLALLSVQEGVPATANLMAPVAVNLSNRLAVQAIRCDFKYSHRHPVPGLAREEAC